jgi:hypothetical protein
MAKQVNKSARQAVREKKIKISVRLLPSTLAKMRSRAEEMGYGEGISLLAQKLLLDYVPLVKKWQKVIGSPSMFLRNKRKTQTLNLDAALLYVYSVESVRLRMVRRTDLIEAVLILALGQKDDATERLTMLNAVSNGKSLTFEASSSEGKAKNLT